MSDTANLSVSVTQQGITQADKALERLTKTGRKTETQVDALKQSVNEFNSTAGTTNATTKTVTGNLGSIGRSAGAAGIQIQQFVGQVQGGVNPLIALSQQGADLGIVLGAPLVGVLISLGAALGIVATSGEYTRDSIDILADRLEALHSVTETTGGGVRILTEDLRKLAKVDEEAAKIQIAAALVDANVVIRESVDSAKELTDQFDTMFSGLDVVATDKMMSNLDATLQRTGLSVTDLLENTDLYATGLSQLSSFAEHLNGELGLTTDQSVQFIRAINELQDSRSPEALQKLSSLLFDMNSANGFKNKALAEYNRDIADLARKAKDGEDSLGLLQKALGDLKGALGTPADTSAIDGMIDRLEDEAATLGNTTTERALYVAEMNGASEAQLRHIRNLGLQIEAYDAEQKALKDAARERRKIEQERERTEAREKAAAEARQRQAEQERQSVANSADAIINSLKSREEQELDSVQNRVEILGKAYEQQSISEQEFTSASGRPFGTSIIKE